MAWSQLRRWARHEGLSFSGAAALPALARLDGLRVHVLSLSGKISDLRGSRASKLAHDHIKSTNILIDKIVMARRADYGLA
ncbi:hypothetical protein ACP70R_024800 [Stipagrostis hirtigluma subsp. patula]